MQARKPAPVRFAVAWIASAHALAMRSGCARRVVTTRLLRPPPLQRLPHPPAPRLISSAF